MLWPKAKYPPLGSPAVYQVIVEQDEEKIATCPGTSFLAEMP